MCQNTCHDIFPKKHEKLKSVESDIFSLILDFPGANINAKCVTKGMLIAKREHLTEAI